MNVGALRQHSSAIAVDREARTKIQNPKNSCDALRRNSSLLTRVTTAITAKWLLFHRIQLSLKS